MPDISTLANVAGLIIAIVSILLLFSFEYWRKPKLDVKEPHWVGDEFGYRILHVKGFNSPGKLVQRNTAHACTVNLRFFSLAVNELLFESIEGMWSQRPASITMNQSGPQKAQEVKRWNLQPGTDGYAIPIAIKHKGDADSYAFNGESYSVQTLGKIPQRMIPGDSAAMAEVVLKSGTTSVVRYFRIENWGVELQKFTIKGPLNWSPPPGFS